MNKKRKLTSTNHGRETCIENYGQGYVLKCPLPNFSDEQCEAWLQKQKKTQETVELIRSVQNPRYFVPKMIDINDRDYAVLEERVIGERLTPSLYHKITKQQRIEIIDSLSSFLVDMNELKPIKPEIHHTIIDEFNYDRLCKFISTKMSIWFTKNEILQMEKICTEIATFEYTTRLAWSHCDLNSSNVLYNKDTSKLYFIDFAESEYNFIYRDIFAPLQIDLDICHKVYESYTQKHDSKKYSIPTPRSLQIHQIMKYRIIIHLLKRFLKASDDLRQTPQNEKSIKNNELKVDFMREQMKYIFDIQKKYTK